MVQSHLSQGCLSLQRTVCIYMELLCGMQGTTVVLPRLMLGPQMIMVLVYLWSRAYPTANISFMGVVTLQVREAADTFVEV